MSRSPEANKNQRRIFIDTARDLGCDEDEAAFDKKLKQLARHKPPPEPAKKQRKKHEDR